MKRTTIAALIVTIVSLTASLLTLGAILMAPACATEDSRNCYWNAAERGNGEGTSFYDVAGFLIPQGGTK